VARVPVGTIRSDEADAAVGHHRDLGELVLELVEVMDDEPFRKG
jgi:hypothetical protein